MPAPSGSAGVTAAPDITIDGLPPDSLHRLRDGLMRELSALRHQADAKREQIAAVEYMMGAGPECIRGRGVTP